MKLYKPFIFILFVSGLLILSQPVGSKHLYKYTDADGVVHVTDQPPETNASVETRRVTAEPRQAIRISSEKSGGQHKQILQNLLYGPVEVQLRFLEAKNVSAEPALPDSFVLPRGFRGEKVVYTPRNPRQSWSYRVASRVVPGEPNVNHDPDTDYLPPFPIKESFHVSQGFNGTRTHNSLDSKFAIDIPMPIGTPIRAARDGVVMEVNEDFFGAGTDRSRFGNRANSIRVLHADGTMSLYAHLAPERVFVQPGEVVLQGEVIAESGNTGFSSGPHLHFVIQRNIGMRLESLPFTFLTPDGAKIRPETGIRLTGVATPN